MKQYLHSIAEAAVYLPFLLVGSMVATIEDSGPSWKTIASAVAGGAFTVTIGIGGYWLASQDRSITDLRNSYVEAKVAMAGVTATLKSLSDNQQSLKDQLEYERKRRETREEQERNELRAAQAAKK
jgi:hypothetical protein